MARVNATRVKLLQTPRRQGPRFSAEKHSLNIVFNSDLPRPQFRDPDRGKRKEPKGEASEKH